MEGNLLAKVTRASGEVSEANGGGGFTHDFFFYSLLVEQTDTHIPFFTTTISRTSFLTCVFTSVEIF